MSNPSFKGIHGMSLMVHIFLFDSRLVVVSVECRDPIVIFRFIEMVLFMGKLRLQ